jgi:hypothetical protein
MKYIELSLAQLLVVPGWRDVAILAGEQHVDRPVASVQIEPTLSVKDIQPTAMVVVLGPVARSDWRIDSVLRRIAAAGATALILDGKVALMRSTTMLADRLRVVVLGANAAEIVELALTAREIMAKSLGVRARLVLEANTRLMGRTPDPEGVAHVLEGLLGVSVGVIDRYNTCLVGEVSVPQEVLDPGTTVRWTTPNEVYICVPVLEPGSMTTLWLVSPSPAGIPGWLEVVTELLQLGAGALQRWRSALRLGAERDARRRSMFLAELLQLTGPPPSSLRTRLEETDWLVDGWHLGFFFSVNGPVTPGELVPEVSTHLSAAVAESPSLPITEHANGCAGWFTFLIEPADVEVAKAVSALRACQRGLRKTMESSLGVGRLHVGPRGIAETLSEAIGGARLAERRAESGHFVDVRRFGVSDLLLAWTRTESFMPVAQDLLSPIQRMGGDLVETLTVYLDAESSITETAAVLGIHRNTVATRIQRIREVIGSDLSDPDERLAIQLACRAVAHTDVATGGASAERR